ncbi:MAG: hypothetical protein WBQ61_17270 [Candidatus Acidiferrum sp.]
MAKLLRLAILVACLLTAGRAFAAGGTCPSGANYLASSEKPQLVTLSSLGVSGCYYIAANGSDANSGTSESSPWAHLPGMSSCTGNCAAHTPAAGEGYILRGGDTWSGVSVGFNWNWAGTASNPIYIGVDKSWPSGWTRPIWSCDGTTCGGANNGVFISIAKPYVILDNIEMTGLHETGSYHPNNVAAGGGNDTIENLYVHGWSHDSTVKGELSQVFTLAQGDVIRYNLIDGSDTSKDMMFVTHAQTPIAYGNYMSYVQTGLDGCGDNWHDNVMEYMVSAFTPGHQDGLYQYGPCYASTMFMYNNVVRHTTWSGSGGAVKFWMNGNDGDPAGTVGYAFNNVIYDNVPGNVVDVGGHFGVFYGTWYFFNNTVACGTDSDPGNCILGDNGDKQNGQFTGGSMNLYLSDNQWIQASGSILSCTQSTYKCTETGDLLQTVSQAASQGYTDASAFAFQPTTASGSTITAAAKVTTAATATARLSLCTTIGLTNAVAGAACQSDTSYACTFDATNHAVVCPARETVARATEPNVGAYQFGSAEASVPNPPEGLAITVQ